MTMLRNTKNYYLNNFSKFADISFKQFGGICDILINDLRDLSNYINRYISKYGKEN